MIHPELYETKETSDKISKGAKESKLIINKDGEQNMAGSSKQNKQEWMVRSKNKYKRDKYGHIEGENDLNDDNRTN